MLKRKVTAFMDQWIRTKEKKCLVVQGARQTGKTYIIERFAEDNYEELVEINFKQLPSAMDIFSGDLTVDNMVMAMRFRFPEKKITPGKTLIFLDEIQECQEAITSLKFWAIDNRYDVIVSNPPYIENAVIETLQTEVKDYEPRIALDGGEDGLVFYRRITETAHNFLKKGGLLAFEIGYNQGESVRGLMQNDFYDTEVIKDLNDNDRVVIGKLK